MARLRQRLSTFSKRDLLAVGLPLVLLVAAGFWLAAQYIKPAPPDYIAFSTGAEGGAYEYYAARYKEVLERFGVQLVAQPSAGSDDNLRRLKDPAQAVDAGFVQGGTRAPTEGAAIVSLGAIYPEPLWVFYRGRPGLSRLEQLAGRRLAIGPPGSGTHNLATALLDAHGMMASPTRLLNLAGLRAVEALRTNRVDVVFVVGTARSAAVWLLLHAEGVSLMSLDQADAYTRRFSYLSKLVLPHGVISFPRNIPPHDVTLVAPVATVVVREDLHPALLDLLLQAMREVHRESDVFQRSNEFPSSQTFDFPLSDRAARFYSSGPPFLQRYLPFWVANFVDRVLVLLLPLIALLIPVTRIGPQLYAWRVRSRIYRWYGELKYLELQAQRDLAQHTRDEWLREIDRIDEAVNQTPAPLAYTDFVYTLRMHIALVRQGIHERLMREFEVKAGGGGPVVGDTLDSR